MVITHHGAECFKVSAGDTTLVFGPISKKSKLKPANFGADVAFISLNHPDMNGEDEVARGDKKPFIVRGPGEYEIASVFASGFQSQSYYGEEALLNAIYYVAFDGLSVLYLGALGEAKLPQEVIEDIEQVDILFVPIGGEGVLTPSEAHKLAVQLEAKVVIPMHHEGVGQKDALKQFLKEAGAEDVKGVDKITLKPRDVADKSGEVIVLTA